MHCGTLVTRVRKSSDVFQFQRPSGAACPSCKHAYSFRASRGSPMQLQACLCVQEARYAIYVRRLGLLLTYISCAVLAQTRCPRCARAWVYNSLSSFVSFGDPVGHAPKVVSASFAKPACFNHK